MAATPAWPPQSTPRLFVDVPLCAGGTVRVEGAQAHYLSTVMRLKTGDPVKLFDGVSGEWLATRRGRLNIGIPQELESRRPYRVPATLPMLRAPQS